MKLFKLIRNAMSPERSPANGVPGVEPAVLEWPSFRRELHRHRALVDRAGGRYVLVVFTAPSSGTKNGIAGAALLSEVIRERARLTDIVGMFDESGERIGVVLPETSGTGAAMFIRSVDELLRTRLNGRMRTDTPLSCEVSHYPDNGKTDQPVEAAIEPRREVACGESRP
jgi:hypothetical protein